MGSKGLRKIAAVTLSLFVLACSVLQNGYFNDHGQYVPKNPNYKLKDKQGIYPETLDTTSVYKMVKMYNDQKLIYPLPDVNDGLNNIDGELNSVYNYIKFYSNGRCAFLTIPIKDTLGMPNSIEQSDLNPDKGHLKKGYYHSSDGISIQIERFVYGDGQGHYVITNYMLSCSGDTLIMNDKFLRMIYKKEKVPLEWNRYQVDW